MLSSDGSDGGGVKFKKGYCSHAGAEVSATPDHSDLHFKQIAINKGNPRSTAQSLVTLP